MRVEGLNGTRERPYRIGAFGDGAVTLDGTVAVDGPWAARGGGVYERNGSDPVWQLFAPGASGELEMQAGPTAAISGMSFSKVTCLEQFCTDA